MLMTLFLRTLAGAVVWIVILGVAAASICGTVFLWLFYVSLAEETEMQGEANKEEEGSLLGWEKNKKFYTLVLSILATVVCVSKAIVQATPPPFLHSGNMDIHNFSHIHGT